MKVTVSGEDHEFTAHGIDHLRFLADSAQHAEEISDVLRENKIKTHSIPKYSNGTLKGVNVYVPTDQFIKNPSCPPVIPEALGSLKIGQLAKQIERINAEHKDHVRA